MNGTGADLLPLEQCGFSQDHGRVIVGAPLANIDLGVMPNTFGSSIRISPAHRWAVAGVAAAGFSIAGLIGTARAADVQVSGAVAVAGPTAPGVVATGAPAPAGEENMIPPNAEGAPIAAAGGGYCYGGPHPAPGAGGEGV